MFGSKIVKTVVKTVEKIRGKATGEDKTKKRKRRLRVTAILLLILLIMIPVLIVAKQMKDITKRAATATDTDDWVIEERKRSQGTVITGDNCEPIYVSASGGLTGVGYDFISYIERTDNNNPQHSMAQTLQLLDMISVELEQPCTLLGIALMGMETSYWSGGANGTNKGYAEGQFDIYKYRYAKYQAPGVGGGQYWHPLGDSMSEAKSQKNDPEKGWIIQKPGGSGYGYFNVGAFGPCQFEGYDWVLPTNYNKGDIGDVGKNWMVTEYTLPNKDKIDSIMSALGKTTYWADYNSYVAENGKSYSSFDDFAYDISNTVAAVLSMCTYFSCQTSALPNTLEVNKHENYLWDNGKHVAFEMDLSEVGIDTSTRNSSTLSEPAKNVLAVMYGLAAWNGGGTHAIKYGTNAPSTEKKLKRLLFYDLSVYLANYGVQAFYDKGWESLSNGTGADAKCPEFEKNFNILMEVLYPSSSTTNIVAQMRDKFQYMWNPNTTAGRDPYVYAINGIIRAQKMLNESAGIVASDGSAPNIYACGYVRSYNITGTGADGYIARAIAAGEDVIKRNNALMGAYSDGSMGVVTVNSTARDEVRALVRKANKENWAAASTIAVYSQDLRWSGPSSYHCGAFFDCSAFVSYCYYTAGLNAFKSAWNCRSWLENYTWKNLVAQGALQVVYRRDEQYFDCGNKKEGYKYAITEDYFNNNIEPLLQPGDILIWATNDKYPSLMSCGHMGIWIGGDNETIMHCVGGRYKSGGTLTVYGNDPIPEYKADGSIKSSGNENTGPGIRQQSITTYYKRETVCVLRITDESIVPLGGDPNTVPLMQFTAGTASGTNSTENTQTVVPYSGNAQKIQVAFDHTWRFAQYSAIHSGVAWLYYPDNFNGRIVCINAGHGTDTDGAVQCTNSVHKQLVVSSADAKIDMTEYKNHTYAVIKDKDGKIKGTLTYPNTNFVSKVTDSGTNGATLLSNAVSSGTHYYKDNNHTQKYQPSNPINYERGQTLYNALKLKKELLDNGYGVLMIRDQDSLDNTNGNYDNARTQFDNIARTVMANNIADVHIALHYDSGSAQEQAYYVGAPTDEAYKDVPVDKNMQYFEIDNEFGNIIIQYIGAEGHPIKSEYHAADNDLTQTAYSVIPSIDVEIGYQGSIRTDELIEKFCVGVRKGLDNWFSNHPVSQEKINARKNNAANNNSTNTGTTGRTTGDSSDNTGNTITKEQKKQKVGYGAQDLLQETID